MARSGPLARIRRVYETYPRQFWTLTAATFIDRLGGAFIFPFLTLYITRKFGVGMTEVGVIFGLFSASSVVGGVLGGAWADQLGRKRMILIGLVLSALTSVLMGVIADFTVFTVGALVVGLFSNIGGPAQQAMVADLLPKEKRAQGFGILRVVINLAIVIGPAIAGVMAARSYLWLFIGDAVLSSITALIVLLAIRETRPADEGTEEAMSLAQTLRGYGLVLQDRTYVLFIVMRVLSVTVAMQFTTTLPVYLRDVHGITEQAFGSFLSLNALLVVLFQFPFSRRTVRYPPMVVMMISALFYAAAFGLYGAVATYALFLLAVVLLTVGEMLAAPTSQALVASFAPEDMRGRYVAVFDFSWVLPAVFGPLLSGIVMDNFDPRWLWYSVAGLGVGAALGYLALNGSDPRLRKQVAQEVQDG